MTERLIDVRGVEICTESFGDPADPTILLVHGAQASMLWWPRELCERIAAAGRHVIRYDNRDTGRSASFPVGAPGYAMSDLADDAVGVLDAHGVDAAHVVGRSMAGGIALMLGLDHPGRVETVTLVTTAADDGAGPDDESDDQSDDELPGPADPDDPADPVEQTVAVLREASGGSPYFDEAWTRETARLDHARTRDLEATFTNHWVMDYDAPRSGGSWADLAQPALVVAGELDPWCSADAGARLAALVPGAGLLVLPRTGHDVPAAVWDLFVPALLRHTGGTDRTRA